MTLYRCKTSTICSLFYTLLHKCSQTDKSPNRQIIGKELYGRFASHWLFFEESVTAAIARKLGSAILTTEKNQISIQRCKEFFISIPVSLSNENIIISDSEKTYYEGLCEG